MNAENNQVVSEEERRAAKAYLPDYSRTPTGRASGQSFKKVLVKRGRFGETAFAYITIVKEFTK